jgi:hypothetical protein
MHALDEAYESFHVAPTTAVTVVDRTTSAQLLASRGDVRDSGRRPEDARADRITLWHQNPRHTSGQTLVTFWGASAWSLADMTLVTLADSLRLGRAATVGFDVRFGDGTVYRGEVQIARGMRRGRARLAEACRRPEVFAACFCPGESAAKVNAMLAYFLQNYEIGSPIASTQRTRTRKTTPESTPISGPKARAETREQDRAETRARAGEDVRAA